jgi:hypothetical protein
MRRLSSAFLRSPAWSCRSDAAAAEVLQASSARARLSQSLLDIPAHARAAKNCLALCCWELSQGADCNTERWAPYRAWAAQLDHNNDAVITFNYDTACEQVLQHVGEQVPSYALRVRGAFRVRAKSLWTAPNEGFLELCACWSAPTSARRRTTSVRHPAGWDDLTPPAYSPPSGVFKCSGIAVQVRPESAFKCRRNGCSSAPGIRSAGARRQRLVGREAGYARLGCGWSRSGGVGPDGDLRYHWPSIQASNAWEYAAFTIS